MPPPFTVLRIELVQTTLDPDFETDFAPQLRQPGAKFSYATRPGFRVVPQNDGSPLLKINVLIGVLDEAKRNWLEFGVATDFVFSQPEKVTAGLTPVAQNVLAAVYNTAQAYAIGAMAVKMQELGLGTLRPARIVPPTYYLKDIGRVLAALQNAPSQPAEVIA